MSRKPRVLLIEDDRGIGNMLKAWFQVHNYPHDIATNGAIALHLLHDFATSGKPFPQVIILDINLPEIDGCAFIEKARILYPGLPIIVYTASMDAHQEERLERARAERILFKSNAGVRELLAVVDLFGS